MSRPELNIGFFGATKTNWQSVDHVYSTMLDACRNVGSVFFLEGENAREIANQRSLHLVVSFSGSTFWRDNSQRKFPVLYPLLGSATLNWQDLHRFLPNLTTSDAIMCNCTADLRVLNELAGPNKPKLLHIPLSYKPIYLGSINKRKARDVVGIEGYDLVVGYVARILPQKNLHRFLEIVAHIRTMLAPVRVAAIVIGDFWSDYPTLNFSASSYSKVIARYSRKYGLSEGIYYWPSRWRPEELRYFYGAMDLLVHPSHSLDENFGLVVVEAMACGVPTIATDYGGFRDTIENHVSGIRIPTWTTRTGLRSDFIFAAEQCVLLLSDPKRLTAMSNAARARAETNFSLGHFNRSIAQHIYDLVDGYNANANRVNAKQSEVLFIRRPHPNARLPAIEAGWPKYEQASRLYCGTPPPTLHHQSFVHASSEFRLIGRSRAQFLDPTWPMAMSYQALKIEAVLKASRRVSSVANLINKTGVALRCLQSLVDVGALTVTKKTSAVSP